MSTDDTGMGGQTMVADEPCFEANALSEDGDGRMVAVVVTMPLDLKRKLHVEAKRRQQSLSEFICAKCDFQEATADI